MKNNFRQRTRMDQLGLPSLPGLPSIRRLRRAMPNVGIIALTLLNSARIISKAIGAGADEVIYKGSIFWDLAPAIERIFAARNRDNCVTDSAFKPQIESFAGVAQPCNFMNV
jgi:DNA-binding NarL/FixJ family response regulator